MNNPFDITKAVDFTNNEIVNYWVDINQQDGFQEMLKPTSRMPMILLGSKGSGKTHLMRYFSFELQKIKYPNLKEGLEKDKFIGVYVRCSGFNSERFSKKGQSDEIWATIYSYYWELWIGQILLNIMIDLKKKKIIDISDEKILAGKVFDLFFIKPECSTESFEDIIQFLIQQQRKVDYQVENCLFSPDNKMHIDFLLYPTALTYGLPELLVKYIPFLKNKVFLYLVDELENFTENQQKLIQTLLREKPLSCTFRIGARLYGIRTYKTLGSGEENKNGSEFEEVILDDFLRKNKNYNSFMTQICENRLRISGIKLSPEQNINEFIDSFNLNNFLLKITEKSPSISKAYLKTLQDKLKGIESDKNIAIIIENLTYDTNILLERANVFLFYRSWKDKINLVDASIKIALSLKDYINKMHLSSNMHEIVLQKFKKDIVDKLARECRESIPYYGFSEFVEMSCGTPRNLLNILKNSFKWSFFISAKEPFKANSTISQEAQAKGIHDTIDWFFEDNRIPSINNYKTVDCIYRLGDFLRDLKYSDVPPECSINLFGLNYEDLSSVARETLDTLVRYSYLIEVNERRDKNSNNKKKTFIINYTIAPYWELSISKRGVVFFTKSEAENIFNLDLAEEFTQISKKKMQIYNSPFNKLQHPSLFTDLANE